MNHADYLRQLVDELAQAFDGDLLGVYLFGSTAYGADDPGISDIDVQAVVSVAPSIERRAALAHRLSHAQLPCPARRLEFVLHEARAVAVPQRRPPWLLNLNTGANEADRVSFDPASESGHWFVLDIAIGRRLGRALLGPSPEGMFAPIPRPWQLEAIVESLAWHREHEPHSANAVLNAARGWRYAETGVHGGKRAAVAWVRQHRRWREVVDAALAARAGGPAPQPRAADEFVAHVEQELRLALAAER